MRFETPEHVCCRGSAPKTLLGEVTALSQTPSLDFKGGVAEWRVLMSAPKANLWLRLSVYSWRWCPALSQCAQVAVLYSVVSWNLIVLFCTLCLVLPNHDDVVQSVRAVAVQSNYSSHLCSTALRPDCIRRCSVFQSTCKLGVPRESRVTPEEKNGVSATTNPELPLR